MATPSGDVTTGGNPDSAKIAQEQGMSLPAGWKLDEPAAPINKGAQIASELKSSSPVQSTNSGLPAGWAFDEAPAPTAPTAPEQPPTFGQKVKQGLSQAENKVQGAFGKLVDLMKEKDSTATPVSGKPSDMPSVDSSGQPIPLGINTAVDRVLASQNATGEPQSKAAQEVAGQANLSKRLSDMTPSVENAKNIAPTNGEETTANFFSKLDQDRIAKSERDQFIQKGFEWEHAKKSTLEQLTSQAGQGALDEMTLGLAPKFNIDPQTGWEQVAKASGNLAGFLAGPGLATAKGIVGLVGGLNHVAGESFVKAIAKDVVSQSATLGIASGLATTGQALNPDNPEDAAHIIARATVSGAGMGAVFGAFARVLPEQTVAQIAGRILGINVSMDAINGTNPDDARSLQQKFFDYGLNTAFALKGSGKTEGGWFTDKKSEQPTPHEQAIADAEILNAGKELPTTDESRVKAATLVALHGDNKAVEHAIDSGNQGIIDQMLDVSPKATSTIEQLKAKAEAAVPTAMSEAFANVKEVKPKEESATKEPKPAETTATTEQEIPHKEQGAVRNYVQNLLHNPSQSLIDKDIALNKLLGGENETISARIGKSKDTSVIAATLAKALDNIDPGHIERALADVKKEAVNPELVNRRNHGEEVSVNRRTRNQAGYFGGVTIEQIAESMGTKVLPEGEVAPSLIPKERGPTTTESVVEQAKAHLEIIKNGENPNKGNLIKAEKALNAAKISEASKTAAHSAENPLPLPTEGQINAGNYPKGHVSLNGLDVTIENPRGSTRTGVQEGKPWQVKMQNPYGYIRKTEGADGDHMDVYLGDHITKQSPVFVIDQIDPKTKQFDEHKVIYGARGYAEAKDIYDNHFSDKSGPNRRGSITKMPLDEFKDWIKGDTTQPLKFKEASQNKTVNFAEDMLSETKALTRLAHQKGFKDIDDFAKNDAEEFRISTEKWRNQHPIEQFVQPTEQPKMGTEIPKEGIQQPKEETNVTEATQAEQKQTEQPQAPIRAAVETLVKYRRFAQQAHLGIQLDKAIVKAKAALTSGEGDPAVFMKAAAPFKKEHPEAYNALKSIADSVKPIELATKQVGANLSPTEKTTQKKELVHEAQLRGLETFEKTADELKSDIAAHDKKNGPFKMEQKAQEYGKQTDTPEFKKWFGDSKVVDEEGKPEIVYHGTDKSFTKFNIKKGAQQIIWFTNDKSSIERGEVGAAGKGKTMELFASLKNPASWKEYDKYGLDELQHKGYDGAILREKDGTYSGFVFEPTQLKDAHRNKGTFNPEDANILHQKEEPYNETNKENKAEPDIYEGLPVREGTIEKQKQLGRDAYRDILGPYARRVGSSLLGSRIAKDFKEEGGSSLHGQVAKVPEDFAVLAQILRDPRIEKFRIFYTKNGKIVGHDAFTSNAPGSVAIIKHIHGESDDEAVQRTLNEMYDAKQRLGADGYWLLHNHPSGRAVPSPADQMLTKRVASGLPGFLGHIVIDHNEYAHIDADGQYHVTQKQMPEVFNKNIPEVPHNALGMTLDNKEDVIEVSKMLENKEGYFSLIGRTARGEVASLAEFPRSLLDEGVIKELRLHSTLRRFAAQTGSTDVIAVTDRTDISRMEQLVQKGLLMDAVDTKGYSARDYVSSSERVLFKEKKRYQIDQPTAAYGKSRLVYQGEEKIEPTVMDKIKSITDTIKTNFAALKTAYAAAPEVTEAKLIKDKYLGDMQVLDHDLVKIVKSINKEFPTDRQVAITNYIQAMGDEKLLKERADLSSKDFKQSYIDAANLTPKEKELADFVVKQQTENAEKAIEVGVLEHMLDGYVRGQWERETVGGQRIAALANSGILNDHPKEAMHKVFQNYFEGEQAGAVPFDKSIAYQFAAATRSIRQAIAARETLTAFMKTTEKDGTPTIVVGGGRMLLGDIADKNPNFVRPSQARDFDWSNYKTINHPAMRKWRWLDFANQDPNGKPIVMEGEIRVHKDFYRQLNAILGRSRIRDYEVPHNIPVIGGTHPGERMLTSGAFVKSTMLVGPFHQFHLAEHAVFHGVNPMNTQEIDFNERPVLREGVNHGLMLFNHNAMHEFAEGLASGGLLHMAERQLSKTLKTKGVPVLQHTPFIGDGLQHYQEYLFQDLIPRLKAAMFEKAVEKAEERYADQLKSGKLTRDQLLYNTAKQANAAFGELNYKSMGRNPTLQDALRIGLLAPDFLEARLKFAGQALRPYGHEQQAALIRGALIMGMGAQMINLMFGDDHEMHWDRPFSAIIGGREYSPRSVVGDIAHLITDPRGFWYNRINPLWGKPLYELGTGRNSQGQKETIEDGITNILKSWIPIPAQGLFKEGPEMSLLQSVTHTILSSIGVTNFITKTPAEKMIHDFNFDKMPAVVMTDEQIVKRKAMRNIEAKLRGGEPDKAEELFKEGQAQHILGPRDYATVVRRTINDPLVNAFKHLDYAQAQKVWEVASDEEKKKLDLAYTEKKIRAIRQNASAGEVP